MMHIKKPGTPKDGATSVIGIAIAPGIYHIGYLFCMDTYPP